MGDVISKATEVLIHQKATTRKIPMAVFSSLSNHLADGVEIKERQREQLIFLVDLVPLLLHAADELSAHVEWDLPDQLVVVHVDGLHASHRPDVTCQLYKRLKQGKTRSKQGCPWYGCESGNASG